MKERKSTLEERLEAHPRLRERVYEILRIAEDSEGKIDRADEAEQRVIDELRRLGQEVLQDWAAGKEKQKVEELKSELDGEVKAHSKKNSTGTQHSEK